MRVVISSSIAVVALNFLKMPGDERVRRLPYYDNWQACHLRTAGGYLPCAMSNNDDRGISFCFPLRNSESTTNTMGNTPSSQGASPQAAPVGRHASLSRHSKPPPPKEKQPLASALPHHRVTHLHDPFPIPGRSQDAPPTTTTERPAVVSPTAGPLSPRGDPTSPGSYRGTGSPRRRKSLELPDLNRLSLTTMGATASQVAAAGETALVTTPTPRLSPLGAGGPGMETGGSSYVPDTVQQGGVPSGTGRRISMMSGTRADEKSQQLVQDNPYFPAVMRAPVAITNPPMTPAALPNYGYSPMDTGHQHTEDVSTTTTAPTTTTDFTSPMQPKAGKPAPAVVTRSHDQLTTEAGLVTPQATQEEPGSSRTGDETPHAERVKEPKERVQEPPPLPVEEQEQTVVPTLVTWNGGGKEVYVTGTFAENGWRTRLKMNKRCVYVRLSGGTCADDSAVHTTLVSCSTFHRERIASNSSSMTTGDARMTYKQQRTAMGIS